MTLNSTLDLIQKFPFIMAFVLGLLPALIWLWFWLKEDIHPEPAKMITLSFLGGMLAVIIVLPLQKAVYSLVQNHETLSFVLWAGIEEVLKFAFVYFIALRFKKIVEEPVDDIIYLIISALGFVTFENTLFLIPRVAEGDILSIVVHGNLRFVGASLLHIICSGTVGIMLALSFYKSHLERMLYAIIGIIIAIVLHTAFNLFIINGAEKNLFVIFGVVWIGIIVLLLMFEKVKHMRTTQNLNDIQN